MITKMYPSGEPKKSWDILDDIAVIPGYKEIYGKPCTLDNVVSILKQFSVNDWLCNLARLTCLLAGNRHHEEEWCGAFLKWFVSPNRDISKRLQEWDREQVKEGRKVILFTERHIGILIELAIMHAPEEANRVMEFPGDERSIFDALLMVATLEEPATPNLAAEGGFRKAASMFSALWFRSVCPDPRWLAARGFSLFKILQERSVDSWAEKWANLFKAATGQQIDAYYVGGFQSLLVAWGQSVDDLAKSWRGLPSSPEQAKMCGQWNSLQAYYAVRRGDLTTLRKLISSVEDVNRLDDVSLIPLLSYPIVHIQDGRTFPLFLKGIGGSLYEGIYYAVSDAAGESGNTITETRQDIGAIFGHLFEEFVLDMLEDAFGDRLLRNPCEDNNNNEAADGIVLCPNGIIIFQVKGCHIPVRHRYLPKDTKEFLRELERSGLNKAFEQVAQSIKTCRNGLVGGLSMYKNRLGNLAVQPVVITHETIPVFGLTHHILDEGLGSACPDKFTRWPILINPADVEKLACLPPQDNVWDVLTEYVSNPQWHQTSFHNFLGNTGRGSLEYTAQQTGVAVDAVWKYLGIDRNPESNE